MCLLIHQPKGVTFSRQEIRDFYQHNPDGFGVAFGERGSLRLLRLVGSESEVLAAYDRFASGRECVIHFRMATHGKTDLDNAHPYPVTPEIVMAHNGVLSCGNPTQPHMSDTWHLIEYFIRPIAERNPDLLFCPAWGEMLGRMIGPSNKLAFIHKDGRIALVNKSAGVTHKRAWLSNTYAWSAPNKYAPSYGGWNSPRVSPRGAIHEIHDIDELEIADTHDLFDDLLTAYVENAEQGIADWARNNPTRAAIALADLMGCSLTEAEDWLEDYNADAITALAEAIADDVPSYSYR